MVSTESYFFSAFFLLLSPSFSSKNLYLSYLGFLDPKTPILSCSLKKDLDDNMRGVSVPSGVTLIHTEI